MSREELLERRARSMARSMEVEGADYETSRRAIIKKIRSVEAKRPKYIAGVAPTEQAAKQIRARYGIECPD